MDKESCRIFDRMYLHRLMAKHPDWSNARLAREIDFAEQMMAWLREEHAYPVHLAFLETLPLSA